LLEEAVVELTAVVAVLVVMYILHLKLSPLEQHIL
jgi:hypothetical protein